MSSSLNLIESAARDRHAERYRGTRRSGGAAAQASRGTRALESTRRRAGWLLVGLGLRLISSGRSGDRAAAQRTRLIGQ